MHRVLGVMLVVEDLVGRMKHQPPVFQVQLLKFGPIFRGVDHLQIDDHSITSQQVSSSWFQGTSGVQLAAVKGVCVGVIEAKGEVEGAAVQNVRPRGFAIFGLSVQENIVSVLNLRYQWIAAVIR